MKRRSVQEFLKAKRMELLAATLDNEGQEQLVATEEEQLSSQALLNVSEKHSEAQEMIADFAMKEGKYDHLIPSMGLTCEKAMMFESLGVPQQTITALRSLFTSLDKDGG
jgi:hypothetical protein